MNKNKINIAVDGYASCGKSTIAKELAKHFGYVYIDSGAMYRAVTLYFLQNNIDLNNAVEVENALRHISISFLPDPQTGYSNTYLNGIQVEQLIRNREVSNLVSKVSAIASVRHFLVAQQQAMGLQKGVAMDGRDIGTVVFPNAELKLFMTADIEVRTQRRYAELQAKNMEQTFEEIKHNLLTRDHLDSTRAESPLRKADDAIVIDNSGLSPAEQMEMVIKLTEKTIEGQCLNEKQVNN